MGIFFKKLGIPLATLLLAFGLSVSFGAQNSILGVNAATSTAASFSRSGTTDAVTGGTFTKNLKSATGYYQDDSVSGTTYFMQVLGAAAYWTSEPVSISFSANLGGGSTKDLPSANDLYVVLLDSTGSVISSTQTMVSSEITNTTGSTFTVSVPVANNVWGVKLYHLKLDSYNVRYYSINLSYVTNDPTVAVTSVTINKSTSSLFVGQTEQLSTTDIQPGNATDKTITWSSNNTSVVTVNSASGLVTAVGAGTATVKAQSTTPEAYAQCVYTVSPVAVTGVTLNKTSFSMETSYTDPLTATVAPANATNKSVTWSSNNSSVASVSTSGLVTAVSIGTATITVTTSDGGFTASCDYTITSGPSYTHSVTENTFSVVGTVPGASVTETKTLSGIDWTLTMIPKDATSTVGISTYDSTRGIHFGTNASYAKTLSLQSTLFKAPTGSATKISKIVVNASGTSTSAATLNAKVGNTVSPDSASINSATPNLFTFNFSTPVYGHIQLDLTNNNQGFYIKGIYVYAQVDADLTAAIDFSTSLEGWKTCSQASDAYTALNATYTSLSSSSKAFLSNMILNDYASLDTSYSGAKTFSVSATDKWNFIVSHATPSSPISGTTQLVNSDNSILIIVIISALGLTSVLAYSLGKKKEEQA